MVWVVTGSSLIAVRQVAPPKVQEKEGLPLMDYHTLAVDVGGCGNPRAGLQLIAFLPEDGFQSSQE